MTGKKAQRKSSSISIQAYIWGDHRVNAWEKRVLRAETSVQETEPGQILYGCKVGMDCRKEPFKSQNLA